MQKPLEDIINQINRKWGHQAIRPAHQINREVTKIKSGFTGLDAILDGIAKGHVSELAGRPTSGLTTLGHYIAASAQKAGDNVVYVQMDNTLDGNHALQCGVKLDKLLSVETQAVSASLDVVREVVSSGVVGLVVLNLHALRQRNLDLQRILLDIRSSDCAVVVLLPSYSQSNVASLRLVVQRQRWLRRGQQVLGCLSSVIIQKNKLGHAGNHALLLMPLVQEAWT